MQTLDTPPHPSPPEIRRRGTTRRSFVQRGLAAGLGVAIVGADALWRSPIARAYVPCSCLTFVPDGYVCVGNTLYLAGSYHDCRTFEYCYTEWLPVGCCY